MLLCVGAGAHVQANSVGPGWLCPRLAEPPDCFVSEHPGAQAEFQQRCTENPDQCTFRPNGTISRWAERWAKPSRYPLALNYFGRPAEPSTSQYFQHAADAVQRPEVQPQWPSAALDIVSDEVHR
jgi:hypothetical protein